MSFPSMTKRMVCQGYSEHETHFTGVISQGSLHILTGKKNRPCEFSRLPIHPLNGSARI